MGLGVWRNRRIQNKNTIKISAIEATNLETDHFRHPEQSRGIPLRKPKGNFHGIPRVRAGLAFRSG
jgi:hypothetical protein